MEPDSDLQQHLIKTAFALFYRQGFHATGVEQIRAEAGVSKKTLYKYFPAKDDLIGAVLSWRHQDFLAQLRRFVEAEAITQRPAAYLAFIRHWSQQADFHGCLFVHAVAEFSAPDSLPFQQAKAHKQQLLELLTEYYQAAGSQQAAAQARLLFVLGEGLITTQQLAVSNITPADWQPLVSINCPSADGAVGQ